MYRIKNIFIYPIKGMRGISLSNAIVLAEGLEHDRRWMLVDNQGIFISQRTHKKLARFSVSINQDQLFVEYENDSISFKMDQFKEEDTLVSVWDDHNLISKEVDPTISIWFSEILGTDCKLVSYHSETKRKKRTKSYSSPVSFADGYPFLFLGTNSMDFLNDKLKSNINSDRFRPNVVIQTDHPHEEDNWDEFSIGAVKFRNIKPCARCIVPNIDQTTGKLGNEPNKTLSNYRKIDDKIYFGSNVIALNKGQISINDTLILSDVHRD